MQTERFNSLRKAVLQKIFKKAEIIKIWKNIVKHQLKNVDILDIFDNYDFTYNIEERSQNIRNEILSGTYKATPPLIYRIEKKYGICRHMVLPQPIDALILQVLVEYIYKDVIAMQPSQKTFFSRDRNNVNKPHEFSTLDYSWIGKWKAMQTQIYKFNTTFDYIVVTDLSNYYDSINVDELRKVFSSYHKIDEVIIDLLFNTIEQISWVPDYLPYSHRGLPTSNIEAIRLLAHSFLFEIDKILMVKTNDNFVRWMDDIVIGVPNKKNAIEILSVISDMLKSRGLSLNLAKTDIYSAREGLHQFQIEQNEYIDSISSRFLNCEPTKDEMKEIFRKFKKHLLDKNSKYREKITKRYITFFSKHKCKNLLSIIRKMYIGSPNLRENIILYLVAINYSKKTAMIVLDILDHISIFDDVSLFKLTNLITIWSVPITKDSDEFLNLFEKQIICFSKKRKLPMDFYCLLWFKTKYNAPKTLLNFIDKYRNLWQSNLFLRRQVTGIIGRILYLKNDTTRKLLDAQFLSGNNNIVALANQIKINSELNRIDKKLNMYLFNNKLKKPYSLQRFLVLCSILNSPNIRNNRDVKQNIEHFIFDPYYLKWINYQYYHNPESKETLTKS